MHQARADQSEVMFMYEDQNPRASLRGYGVDLAEADGYRRASTSARLQRTTPKSPGSSIFWRAVLSSPTPPSR